MRTSMRFVHHAAMLSAIIAACVVTLTAGQARQTSPPPAAAASQGPDRSKPPALAPAPALKVPAIQKQKLSNGLPVWVVQMPKVPVVDVTLLLNAGSSSDPAGKFGLAS